MDIIQTLTTPGGATYEMADGAARTVLNTITPMIPSNASSNNKLATQSDIIGSNAGFSIVSGKVCVTYQQAQE